MVDFTKLGERAAASGADQTQAKAGGSFTYEPPAAGPCRLRFVGYVELGKQEHTWQGKTSFKDKVALFFEVNGPKHPPRVLDDGTTVPHVLVIEENLSLSDKAHFFKLFTRMNYAGAARHMVQLLGQAYKGTIIHRKYAKRGEDKTKPETWTGIAAELFEKGVGYTIAPPRLENEEGDLVEMKVAPATVPIKVFVWDQADMEQWGTIFIDGEYPERKDEKTGAVIAPAKSKNVWQNTIKGAKNFSGSPIHSLLVSGGQPLDLPAPGDDPDEAGADDGPANPAHDPSDDIPF